MTKNDVEFIKKSKKFIVIKDETSHEFTIWEEAATFYNNNIKTSKNIEISAICGIVGKTIAYKYN